MLDKNEDNHINNNKESVAKKRWGLLAKALQSPSQLDKHLDCVSLRRFSSYTLIECERCNIDGEEWFKYTARIDRRNYWIVISHPQLILTPTDLTGFNNTGNICVWPSEEILAYYALSNPQLFINKNVLELGGGMSCLAGLMIARHLHPNHVHLTDGNVNAIKNVYRSLKANFSHQETTTTCSVLKWDRNEVENDAIEKYDVILCADCCFFDESREDLIQCIWNRLSVNGLALIMAPKRGNTLQEFIIQAKLHGFVCRKMIYYNKNVWDRHVSLLENPDYHENVHFPLLIYLRKDINANRSN